MDFKQDFQTALSAGRDYDALMALVRHHREQGLSVDAAYKALEEIWLEHGFDEREGDEEIKDHLETVMEKVWYGFPVVE